MFAKIATNCTSQSFIRPLFPTVNLVVVRPKHGAKMMKKTKRRSRRNKEQLPSQIMWFVLGPLFGFLAYFTQIRVYLLTYQGTYFTGFIDGILASSLAFSIILWLTSKFQNLNPSLRKNRFKKSRLKPNTKRRIL